MFYSALRCRQSSKANLVISSLFLAAPFDKAVPRFATGGEHKYVYLGHLPRPFPWAISDKTTSYPAAGTLRSLAEGNQKTAA